MMGSETVEKHEHSNVRKTTHMALALNEAVRD